MTTCFRCDAPSSEMAHVFSRMLFPKRPPENLPTVPSCHQHNADTQKDEELFAVAVNDYWSDQGRKVWDERVRRGLRRPEAARFKKQLADNLSRLLVPTGDDRRWGHLLRLDRARINRVLEHILRGLTYYHGAGQKLDTAEFVFGCSGFGDAELDAGVMDLVKSQTYYSLGDVVDYRWGCATDDPRVAIAGVRFYHRTLFVIGAQPREGARSAV